MQRNRDADWDVVLYAASAITALGVPLTTDVAVDREWARFAGPAYAAGALVALLIAIRRAGLAARALLAGAVFVTVALVPLGIDVQERADHPAAVPVKSDVLIIEGAAEALIDRDNPYEVTYRDGPLAKWPEATRTHFPYLPASVAFGMPRAVAGPGQATDARIAFLLVTVAITAASLWWSVASAPGRLRAFQVLLVLATGAPLVYTSGKELPVLALMLASLVALDRRHWVVAGATAGIAASAHQLAWAILPFLPLAPPDAEGRGGGRRTTALALATMLTVIGPFVVWNAPAFVADAIWFPLGFGQPPGSEGSFTPGSALAAAFPQARWALVAFFVTLVATCGVVLAIRTPRPSAADVARSAGLVILAALLLAPRTRIAYFAFPLNLLLWAGLLRSQPAAPTPPERRVPAGVTAASALEPQITPTARSDA